MRVPFRSESQGCVRRGHASPKTPAVFALTPAVREAPDACLEPSHTLVLPVPSIRPRPWMLVSAFWVLPALLATLNEVAQRRLSGGQPPRLAELLFAGGDWLIYSFLTPAAFVVARRWPLARPHLGRHGTIHLVILVDRGCHIIDKLQPLLLQCVRGTSRPRVQQTLRFGKYGQLGASGPSA